MDHIEVENAILYTCPICGHETNEDGKACFRCQSTQGARRTAAIKVEVDDTKIDETINKANRLVELLKEASAIIDSLSGRKS